MIYHLSLKNLGLIVGILLVAVHAMALVSPASGQSILRHFPRNKFIGTILLAIATIWSFWLIATMDLGEFSAMRHMMLFAIPVAGVLMWYFVDEFLAVRSLGMLALLASEPLLESAFLKTPESRLLLVILAYAWIVAGLFWVGMPFTLRNQIKWVTENSTRWKLASIGGIVYGALLIASALLYY
ncbi:MAG: hypothetical protein ABI443_02830 [Chthoniobacterales bacterium]